MFVVTLHYTRLVDVEIVWYLIGECRCDLMSKNVCSDTPLHNACRNGHIEIVLYLIGECLCDPMSKNSEGNTQLHAACSKKGYSVTD